MVERKSVSVILPCYNEGERILPVVEEVKKSSVVSEIVIVDDGSDKFTKDVLKKITGVKIIHHIENQGKSKAMQTGVLNVTSDIVVFLDTDLSGFRGIYINDLVRPIVQNDYDLVLGDYEKELKFFKLIGLSIVLTGQRAIKRDLLLKNMNIFDYGGYLAEVAMNKIFFKKNKIKRIFLKNVGQVFKYQKNGMIGFLNDLKFFFRLIKKIGLRELVNQILYVKMLEE